MTHKAPSFTSNGRFTWNTASRRLRLSGSSLNMPRRTSTAPAQRSGLGTFPNLPVAELLVQPRCFQVQIDSHDLAPRHRQELSGVGDEQRPSDAALVRVECNSFHFCLHAASLQ